MNDCANAEIRDRLPDLMHERLDAHARALILAHVNGCADCRAELQLLRDLRAVGVRDTPRVDVASIVAALPVPATRVPSHHRWTDWRIAAAVTVLAVGGGSVLVLSHGKPSSATDAVRSVRIVAPPRVIASTPSHVAAPAPTPAASAAPRRSTAQQKLASAPTADAQGLDMTGHLADLSSGELRALLGDIATMEAIPLTEPEAVEVPITTRNGSADGEELP